ncbi:nucleoside triphosphate pyrophosphohydrolase [Salibacterium halotolerans]|uniref:Tetrapyrrole methylase family protein / MazG family protein n=1 Tax=Salibacterium halotolerans TaxID=1884432 RepID=A0A1I5WLU1_9BACI|nr:nucleoside triphosphate pyrophosphohydrolase [Salibacterium halotolerans]SFQ20557.1 tetrapyrrole methylase family protein / MazG family protein [Salibacterium halotolerans]
MTTKQDTYTNVPVIHIIGLGPGDLSGLALGTYKTLTKAERLYLRTEEHPSAKELKLEGISFHSFDERYEQHDTFEAVYAAITGELLEAAGQYRRIYYAVPGHPMTAEDTVQQLLEEKRAGRIHVTISGGQSFLDPMFTALQVDPNDGFQLLDATALNLDDIRMNQHIIISQVYDQLTASEVKLTLMEKYPDDYGVTLVTAAGMDSETLRRLPLYELDRMVEVDNLTALYVPPAKEQLMYRDFSTLRRVIDALRAPDGCPWDRKQTHESLKKYMLEEAYEVLDAIDEQNDDHLEEELGDVLLQVLLHARIGEEDGFFTIDDVIGTLTEKMIRRHPHVFGGETADTEEQVNASWEALKEKEKADQPPAERFDDIPGSMPALMQAYELQKKAGKAGFDWDDDAPMWKKLQEELAEWLYEMKHGSVESRKKEYGDVLFVIVNLGRFYKLYPEEALYMTNRKFRQRFDYVEEALKQQGRCPEDATLEEMDGFWEEAKTKNKGE